MSFQVTGFAMGCMVTQLSAGLLSRHAAQTIVIMAGWNNLIQGQFW